MPGPANPDVAWAVEDLRARVPQIARYRNYYDGKHPLNFATDKFRNTFGELFQELADNLCDDVVDEPADRLAISSWSGNATAAKLAAQWWETERGDAKLGSVAQNAFRAADGWAIVWDNGDEQPRLYVQDPQTMAGRYSLADPDQLEVAAKCWREGKGYRLNLYYSATPMSRGRIEHYYSKGVSTTSGEKGIPQANSFLPFTGMDANGEPVDAIEFHDRGRMPVFHFPNGELGRYGASALQDVTPLQDALNKSICDMLVAGEAYALPHRWATGIQVMKDASGKEISPFKNGDNLWWTASDKAHFGYFPAAEMKGFLDQQRAFRLEIARKGGLPAHSVDIGATGNAPSGLSLLIAEGKLIKRCKDRQRDWGVVWRELVAYALTWLGAAVTSADLVADWAPPETRDEQTLLEGIVLKRNALGTIVPDAQFAREAGYTDEQLKSFAVEKEEENAQKMDAAQAALGSGRISAPPASGLAPLPPVQPNGASAPVA